MGMGGIYRGLVEDALSLARAPGAGLWVVRKDTSGPFAEVSRMPEDIYRVIGAADLSFIRGSDTAGSDATCAVPPERRHAEVHHLGAASASD
jgi:hypothetical protein